ncbi:hypothetical protein EG329_003621 [Mollisiaceae sp. DMI_Dod_QoI]|nr:hypothetical protein EG329_003621 [Helotiales sp. DMI_Dod_QoI]
MEKCVDGGSNLRKKSKKIKKRNVDSPRAVPKAGERNGRDYAQEFWEPGLLQSWKARILRPPGKVPAACLLPPASCLNTTGNWQLATAAIDEGHASPPSFSHETGQPIYPQI